MKGRDEIVITQFTDLLETKIGLKFTYANGEKELIGRVFKEGDDDCYSELELLKPVKTIEVEQ